MWPQLLRSERVALTGILVVAAAYMWIYRHMTTDDTFIFLQFANNMLNGQGMSFNPGEPTYGFTSALWVGALYVLGFISSDLLLNAKAMSFTFALGSIVIFYALAKQLLPSTIYAKAATSAWAINPIFVNMAFSGMESTLGTFLLLWGLWQHLKERKGQHVWPWAPTIFALAYLTRPEFGLLFPLWLVDTWLSSGKLLRWKRVSSGVAAYVVLVGGWLGIAFLHFDTIIPNPVVIKAVQSRVSYETAYIVKRFVLMLGSIHAADVLVMLFSVLAFFVWKRIPETTLRTTLRLSDAFLGLWVAGVLASYLFQKVAVSPRYFLVVSPVVTLLAFRLLAMVHQLSQAQRPWATYALVVFVCQSLVATAFIYYPHTATYNEKDKLLKQAAIWLRENSPPDAAVASVDIGILGFYSSRRVVDQTGLVNPDIVYRTSALAYLRDKGVQYLLDRNPEKGYLSNGSRDNQSLKYEPVLFLSTPSRGWTAGLAEEGVLGFTLYRLVWKE